MRATLLNFLFLLLLFPATILADVALDQDGHWNFFGRARFRFEQDNDENPQLGHRTRARIGNFAGIKFSPDENWGFIVRGRLGDKRDSRIVDMTVYTREDFSYGQRGGFADQYFVTKVRIQKLLWAGLTCLSGPIQRSNGMRTSLH